MSRTTLSIRGCFSTHCRKIANFIQHLRKNCFKSERFFIITPFPQSCKIANNFRWLHTYSNLIKGKCQAKIIRYIKESIKSIECTSLQYFSFLYWFIGSNLFENVLKSTIFTNMPYCLSGV